ncbi:MAG: DNA mismatch repair protein MutS, partial [Alphaproteobacteria bacterium]|nr:DNA mismatch repair protein MutS [Alphaproteobacteria bacterium]
MMEQYFHIKQAHPGCLLFYRMGDFYELFFDDAVAAAAALDITLTRRGKHEGEDIPMCGVPVHSHDSYLAKLIRKGFKVAVAEQTEDPAAARKRGGKALVRRDVVRVVTAGTLTEDTLLDARSHNYLAALAEVKGEAALAWLDISTGDFRVQDVARAEFAAALARFEPKELLVCERLLSVPELYELFNEWKDVLTPLADSRFDSTGAKRRLENLYGVKALDAFGAFSRAGLSAAGAVVDYVELTQKGRLPRLAPPQPFACGSVLEVDPATMRNLELFQTLSGARDGSLLHTVDATLTGAGARLLAAHLTAPLTDVAAIARRLHMVGFFVENGDLR